MVGRGDLPGCSASEEHTPVLSLYVEIALGLEKDKENRKQ